jgi:hypothetical protein
MLIQLLVEHEKIEKERIKGLNYF